VSDYKPKPGDRVLVTVAADWGTPSHDYAYLGHGWSEYAIPRGMVQSIEPAPEPEWQRGDVVRAADGRIWMLTRAGGKDRLPWVGIDEIHLAHTWAGHRDLPRPLTLLVRDGKAVPA
jgi:hypothetical protein